MKLRPGVGPFAARIAALALRALAATWRIEVIGRNPMGTSGRAAEIGVFWHENVLVMAALFRARGVSVSVSRSRDGDLISGVLDHLGYAPAVRGSSSSGAVSLLRELVRRIEGGSTVAVPVDGPRGPAHQAKAGVVLLAAKTGVPLTPVRIEARPVTRFASWDRTVLPWPFARVRVHFGDAIGVPADVGRSEREGIRLRIEALLGG